MESQYTSRRQTLTSFTLAIFDLSVLHGSSMERAYYSSVILGIHINEGDIGIGDQRESKDSERGDLANQVDDRSLGQYGLQVVEKSSTTSSNGSEKNALYPLIECNGGWSSKAIYSSRYTGNQS